MRKEVLFVFAVSVFLLSSLCLAEAKISITGDAVSITGNTNLEVSSLLLKVSLHHKSYISRSISISSDSLKDITLEINNLQGVSLSESEFTLQKSETKKIEVNFNSSSLNPGVYVGSLIVRGNGEMEKIPVIFEVESQDVFFDINLEIPPASRELGPGGRFAAQIKVFDLTSGGTTNGVGSAGVDMEYYLYDLAGNILSSESESIVVEQQTSLTKTISLPSDIDEGNYVFVVIANYKTSTGVSSNLLSVRNLNEENLIFSPLPGLDNFNFALLLGVFLVIFLGVIFIFAYLIHDRNKLFLDLKRYNNNELRSQREFLAAQEQVLRKKDKSETVKNEAKKEFKEKVKKLKEKQKRRVNDFKRLKKSGDTEKMRKQLAEWKNKGYNTFMLESKLKGLTSKDMNSIIDKWKKEGYR